MMVSTPNEILFLFLASVLSALALSLAELLISKNPPFKQVPQSISSQYRGSQNISLEEF